MTGTTQLRSGRGIYGNHGLRYDLDTFLALNEEYADHPLVANPRGLGTAAMTDQAERRAKAIAGRVDVRRRRVLEIGCGRGHLGQVLANDYESEYVGLDVVRYDNWETQANPAVTLAQRDISTEPADDLGSFDMIVSLAVLEHVVHPFGMLKAMYDRLRPGGVAHLAANLHRGPKASHRYREVFFPWPHLLFDHDVWREFYRTVHHKELTFSWVNKLTYEQYLAHFDRIGFGRRKVWLTGSTFDADFYARFESQLSAYPKHDLSHDFIYAVLERPESKPPERKPTRSESHGSKAIESGLRLEARRLRGEVERLDREVAALRSSTSWRATAPLRWLSRRFKP